MTLLNDFWVQCNRFYNVTWTNIKNSWFKQGKKKHQVEYNGNERGGKKSKLTEGRCFNFRLPTQRINDSTIWNFIWISKSTANETLLWVKSALCSCRVYSSIANSVRGVQDAIWFGSVGINRLVLQNYKSGYIIIYSSGVELASFELRNVYVRFNRSIQPPLSSMYHILI
mgnify:CR=1 FL=1